MFALHRLLDQRLRKLFLLCLVFSYLFVVNPQWVVAQDNPPKGGGLKNFMERFLKPGKTATPSSQPTSPTISSSPTFLSFTITAGSTTSASQSLTITNTSTGSLSWTASETASWMSLNPTSGSLTAGQITTATVAVNPTGLTANIYTDAISITTLGATPLQVPITLAITAPSSGKVTLTWDPETDPSVKGYKVYAGTSSGIYWPPVDVGNFTTFPIINLQSGTTYYFAVTAYNSGGESGYSNEVNKAIP